MGHGDGQAVGLIFVIFQKAIRHAEALFGEAVRREGKIVVLRRL